MSIPVFLFLLFILESYVVAEGWCAKAQKLFKRSQGRVPSYGKKIGYFYEHGGMWGDFFLISPLTAFIVSSFWNQWNWRSITECIVVSLLLGSIMLYQWCQASYRIEEVFSRDGEATFAGWVHFKYMTICLMVVLLYYFGTPHLLVQKSAPWVTLILAVHVPLGLLQPKWMTEKRVARSDLIATAISWILLGLGYFHITH